MYPDQLPEQLSEQSRKRREKKRTRQRVEFIKGPIRVEWLCRTARLPGKAIATALALLFKASVAGTTKDLPLTPELLERFGVKRRSSYRAVAALEEAGLVKVKRHRGRCPRVTIVRGFAR